MKQYVEEYNQENPNDKICGFEIELEVDIAAYYMKNNSTENSIMKHQPEIVGSTYIMEGDKDGVSGSPNDLDGTIRIPTLKGTHHYLFNDDGTFNFDPTTLPESRDKKAENNKINSNSEYPGVGLPPP